MVVYCYDSTEFYEESAVDVDPATGLPECDGYVKYEIPDVVTLTAEQCLGSYGSFVEILFKTGQLKRL